MYGDPTKTNPSKSIFGNAQQQQNGGFFLEPPQPQAQFNQMQAQPPQAQPNKCLRSRWTAVEDAQLRAAVEECSCGGLIYNWEKVAAKVPGKTIQQCIDRWKYILSKRNETEWTAEEDELLIRKVQEIGTKWVEISKLLPGGRTNMACKFRYVYLNKKALKDTNSSEITVSTKEQVSPAVEPSSPHMLDPILPQAPQMQPIIPPPPQAQRTPLPSIWSPFDKECEEYWNKIMSK